MSRLICKFMATVWKKGVTFILQLPQTLTTTLFEETFARETFLRQKFHEISRIASTKKNS